MLNRRKTLALNTSLRKRYGIKDELPASAGVIPRRRSLLKIDRGAVILRISADGATVAKLVSRSRACTAWPELRDLGPRDRPQL